MINMVRTVMEKVESMQEQIDNISRDMEILRKNEKDVLEIKLRMFLMGSQVDWSWLMEESLSVNISQ